MQAKTSDHELIRNTLARYSIGIDERDWTMFSKAFTKDTKVYFPETEEPIEGVQAVKNKIETVVGSLQTQHSLSTQMIEITSDNTAETITYGRAIHFGKGILEGRDVTAWGMYKDKLVKDVFDGREDWRIAERRIIVQAPFKGDRSLLQM